jgi:phosphate:Na+ symporter
MRILPGRPGEEDIRSVTLQRNLLDTPPVAMGQAHKEIVRMGKAAKGAFDDAMTAIRHDNRSRAAKVNEQEDATDLFQTEITRYLVELSQRELSEEMANTLPVLIHTVNDLERIADHAVNIGEAAVRKIDHGHAFSEPAAAEIDRMHMEVNQMFEDVLVAIADFDVEIARRALGHEKALNQMQEDWRATHIERLGQGTCSPMAGLIFVDLVDNLEKIGDHLTNIAEGVVGGLQWVAAPHAVAEPA